MATILLGSIGGALGGSLFGPIGAVVGRAAGALLGSIGDRMIVNALTPPVRHEGPRLTTTDIQTSTEGSVIDRIHGRARVTGQVIWATRFEEQAETEEQGGKGGGPTVVTTTYTYFGNFAVGLCEGPVAGVGRIWADGKEIDQTLFEFRVHLGDEAQEIDPLIEAKEGEGNAPAYRGLAYIVFERLKLEQWGNRLPQISVEVFRTVGDLEPLVQGVAIIAGNEFGYDTELVKQTSKSGAPAENRHTLIAATDWTASLDRLEMLAPNIGSVMLVVPWFGDDLRCGSCTIQPKVDSATKTTSPHSWAVSGLTRSTAEVVTLINGVPAYGGTPSDASVIRAVQDLTERGLDVTLCPFIMMDIASDNTLPDPYSDNAATVGQPAFPWRGRITCSPAGGFAGTVDKTAAAATQVTAFMGTAAAGDFGGSGTTVTYSGPDEWSYRRFVLHCAKLAALAGSVEAFLIGSEMIGLTQVRSSASGYPFVTALKTLAADVSGVLGGGIKVGYAADWSEYNAHRPGDGSGDVFFNLDPLWSDANIDFVGIDNYLPLADWRNGSEHLDFDAAGPTTIYDADYLDGNVEGGEHYDWYYASTADRDSQTRSAISDGANGKPWVFRQKDIFGWWSNAHFNRPGGVESGVATGWIAQGKPIRFTELGCPAVDKGANQPNVFPDPKSAESAYPWYSSRARDDAMQRAWLEAMIGHYALVANNPVSGVYAAAMIDLTKSHVWCWDARPWPSFPLDDSWGDASNWENGHWVSGRLGSAPARETIEAILAGAQFTDFSVEPIPAVVDGMTTGTLGSARSVLDAIRPAYQFDAVESDGVIKFISRLGRAAVATVAAVDLVVEEGSSRPFRQTRAQETELPDAVKLRYGDPARDDQPAAAEARRSAGGSLRTLDYQAPMVMADNIAAGICERELHSAWTGRERAQFALPPSYLALDPGDVVDFAPTTSKMRLSDIADASARSVAAFRVDPLALAPVAMPRSAGRKVTPTLFLDPEVIFVDGPLLQDDDLDHAGYVGGMMLPFRSGIAAWRSPTSSGYVLDTLLPVAATLGVTTADFYSGPLWRWDSVNTLAVRLYRGALSSAEEAQVLNGANALVVENADGEWELLQFATATATGTRAYDLAGLLRGQKGSEHAMRDPVAAGARVLLLNGAVRQTAIPPAMVGLPLNWRVGPSDRDIGSAEYIDLSLTLRGKARRPLAPGRIKGIRDSASGDWLITWIRRTRMGGDSWDVAEVPLGEASESYRLDILDGEGGAVLRSFDTATAQQLYTAAQQTTDFGGAQTTFWARVAQRSAAYGLGIFLEQMVWN